MKQTKVDDSALLKQIAQKDEEALGLLYDRYYRLVYTIAYRVVKNHETAEETTLDIFRQIWRKAHRFDNQKGTARAWISSMSRNRAIDHFRRESKQQQAAIMAWGALTYEATEERVNIERDLMRHERLQEVRQAVRGLSEPQQQALTLAFFWGMSHQEISDHLNVPLGTIKGRIRLAMRYLKEQLTGKDKRP